MRSNKRGTLPMTARPATLIAAFVAIAMSFGAAASARRNNQDQRPAYRNPDLAVDQRVTDLLGRMTVEEKIAQTESLWITNNLKSFIDEKGNFSPDAKVQGILKYGIGQLGGPSQGSSESEKATAPFYGKGPRAMAIFTNTIQKYVVEHNRLGIPTTFHEEALHGLASPGATSFPQAIAIAGTWDVDLVQDVFTVAAREGRSRGAHQVLAPDLDLGREPRWGRTEETYGEDPYLVSRMAVAA